MKQEAKAQALRIYIGEDDHWHGGPLHAAIVEKLKDAGLPGVTVIRGVEGYGAHAKLHTSRIEALFQGLPIIVEAVDIPERIAQALQLLDEILVEALVTVHDVTAVRYIKDSHASS